jgi:hypothetical protein
MPKDATKNVDRYKIRGGQLNEFDFTKNQEQFAQRGTRKGTEALQADNAAKGAVAKTSNAAKGAGKKAGKAAKSAGTKAGKTAKGTAAKSAGAKKRGKK